MKQRIALLITIYLGCGSLGFSADYTAVSLKRAAQVIATKGEPLKNQAANLAGVTRAYALIHDTEHGDLILVGERNSKMRSLTLDEWAVAARSEFSLGCDPVVSIDQHSETAKTGSQRVRFEGALTNTQFGADMLAADIILKQLALGKISAEIFGIRSFLQLSAASYRANPLNQSDFTRFWFLPMRNGSYVFARDGVVVVEEYKIDVQNQRYIDGDATRAEESSITAFASSIRTGFGDLKTKYPELARMEQLYYLTALVQGLGVLGMKKSDPAIRHWLEGHRIASIETRATYPMEENSTDVTLEGGKVATVRLSGGVALDAIVVNLQDGMPDAVRQYVLASRPSESDLSWDVPLVALAWSPDIDRDAVNVAVRKLRSKRDLGMSIQRQIASSQAGRAALPQTSLARIPSADFRYSPDRGGLSVFSDNGLRRPSANVGGVLLNDVARVEGEIGAGATLGKGSFSVVVDGRDCRIDQTAYKRLVTALWAVYFGREDPGISIDPIARGAERQFVRYIGNVKNLDLGRVMRDADYLMKKWAVGTEQPSIATFKTPDDYANELQTLYLGSMSRFWFVPENMKFRVTPDALLFASGNMTVKTEFLMSNAEGRSADPANERFAKWFTDNYHGDIVKRYPIYEQLYDYAKLVALAKYLKESGIPLYWFLMANKDLVLTEEAIGSVPTLFKDSTNFQGVKIEGGVNLVQKDVKSKGYVFDEATRNAIKVAYQKAAAERGSTSLAAERPKYVAQPVSLELGTNRVYTVIPQHSSSSGKDRRGIRYQTDVSLRTEGYEITPSVLAALQPAIRQRHVWNDLRDKMDNLTKGNSEAAFEAAFENALQAAQAKTGEALRKLSLLQGKFYPTEPEFAKDAAFALEDKDQFELLGDILVSYAKYYTSLDLVRAFDPNRANQPGDFGDGWRLLIPYRLRPASNTPAKGYRLPSKMEVVNLITDQREVLDFSTDTNQNIGYFPSTKSSSEFVGLFVLTDASFRLIDRIGCEFQFNSALNLTDMLFTEDHSIGIEYLEKTGTAFEAPPYRIVPENPDDRATFQNVTLPKRMKVTDAFNSVQTLEFDGKKSPIGWYPLKDGASKLKALALMSDGSYVLADARGNEFSFDGGGNFTEVLIGQNEPIVRALKMGKNRISFRYRLDPEGNILIAKAWVGQDEVGAKPLYVINYDYDSTGRLANRNLVFANGKTVFGQ